MCRLQQCNVGRVFLAVDAHQFRCCPGESIARLTNFGLPLPARLIEQLPLNEEFLKNFKSGKWIVEFKQLLLGQILNWQYFSDAITDPLGIVEAVWFRHAFRAEVADDLAQQREQALMLGRECRALVGDQLDLGFEQFVLVLLRFKDAEALAAMGSDLQDTQLLHVPMADPGQRADRLGVCGSTGFFALGNQANAEGLIVLHARCGHVEVALFEDLERQDAAGEKHGLEREERNCSGFAG